MDGGEEEGVRVTVEGQVGTIWLWRPSKGNSLSSSMVSSLLHSLSSLALLPSVAVVVLRAAPSSRFFSTGMDLSSPFSPTDPSSPSPPFNLFALLAAFPKPLIGRIHGPCIGGGIGLLFACDIRVALPSVYISFAEVRRGICPALISALIEPQLGLFKTRQYMMTAERVSAAQLLADGQLSEIVADETELDAAVDRRVQELLLGAPKAMQEIKKLANFLHSHGPDENEVYVQALFNKMMVSEEAQEGMQAFQEKRLPPWVEKSKL